MKWMYVLDVADDEDIVISGYERRRRTPVRPGRSGSGLVLVAFVEFEDLSSLPSFAAPSEMLTSQLIDGVLCLLSIGSTVSFPGSSFLLAGGEGIFFFFARARATSSLYASDFTLVLTDFESCDEEEGALSHSTFTAL